MALCTKYNKKVHVQCEDYYKEHRELKVVTNKGRERM